MTTQSRPLLLTADVELLDDLLGAAIAVGVAVDVAAEPAVCRPQWTDAPLIVVGADLAPAAMAARLGRRTGVLMVARGSPDDRIRAAAEVLGAEQVIGLPDDERVLLDRLADIDEPAARARLIGVVAGRGGAGASILAAALALTAASRGPAWLVDLDPLGGGADAGLGAELIPGSRWADLGMVSGRLSTAALRSALPDVSGVAVLATDDRSVDHPGPEAVRAVLSAAGRAGGTVVVDLPRHGSEARTEALAVLDDLLVVVPAEVRAVLATAQLMTALEQMRPVAGLVIRSVPGGLVPADVLRALPLPLVGVLDDDPAIRAAAAVGTTRPLLQVPALAALCSSVLDSGPLEAAA